MPQSIHPVLVIGAGPTGLTLANLLGRYGVSTVLAEAYPTVNRLPRATFVDDEFFRLLDALGLADAVRRQSISPATYEHYSALGFLLSREEGQITQHNFPTRSAIFQPWLDQTLLDGLARFPHVEVLLGHKVVAHSDNGNVVHVTFNTPDGQEIRRPFSYVLAADGSRSPMREALGIEFEAVSDLESRSLRVDVEGDPDKTPVMRSRPGFGRHASSFPAPNGRRYGFSVKPGEDIDALMSDASMAKMFKPFRDFSDVKVIRKVVYSFRSRVAKQLRKGRVFLLGDAAHVQPPAGSQGMNGGARDANCLAWRIALVYRGIADASLLDTYEQERYPAVRTSVVAASNYMRRSRSLPWLVLRDIWLKIRSLRYWREPVVATLANAVHVETGQLTEIKSGVLVGDPEHDAGHLLGRLLPNPWVELGPRAKLLDELLKEGFSIVGIQVDAPDLNGLNHPLWQALNVSVVLVSRAAGSVPDVVEPLQAVRVADDRFDNIWQAYHSKWIVVRPDRVVAAIVDNGQLGTVADDLALRFGYALPEAVAAAAA